MALFVEANLELDIGGQRATLTGSGSVLRLTLSTPRTLARHAAGKSAQH